MDKSFHTTLYFGCNYLSILGLKLILISKRDPRIPTRHVHRNQWWLSLSIIHFQIVDYTKYTLFLFYIDALLTLNSHSRDIISPLSNQHSFSLNRNFLQSIIMTSQCLCAWCHIVTAHWYSANNNDEVRHGWEFPCCKNDSKRLVWITSLVTIEVIFLPMIKWVTCKILTFGKTIYMCITVTS